MESAVRKSLDELAEVLKRDVDLLHIPIAGEVTSDRKKKHEVLHTVLASNNRKLHTFSLDNLLLHGAAQIEVEYRFPFSAKGFDEVVDRLTMLFGAPSCSLETVLTFEHEKSHVRSVVKSSGQVQLDMKTKLVGCVIGSAVVDGRSVSKTWCVSLEESIEDKQIAQASEAWFRQNGQALRIVPAQALDSASIEGSVTFPLDLVTDVKGPATKEELSHSWKQLRFLCVGRKPNRQFINLPSVIFLKKGETGVSKRHLALGDVTVAMHDSCETTTRTTLNLHPVGVKRRRRLTFTTDEFHVDCTQFKIQGVDRTMYNVEIEFDLKCTRAAAATTTDDVGSFQVPTTLEFLL
jgi:hypothetical protein